MGRTTRAPRSAVVAGAGMVGLSTAWFLQEHGVDVVVVERSDVAAGASWGNAGLLTPSLATPLAEPSVLTHAARAVYDRDAPLHLPLPPGRDVRRFLPRFAARCTTPAWRRSMAALALMSLASPEAFDALAEGGVQAPVRTGPVAVAATETGQTTGVRQEIDATVEAGIPASTTASLTRDRFPTQLSERVHEVFRLEQQRFIEPGPFLNDLALSVEKRGGRIVRGAEMRGMRHGPGGVSVDIVGREPEQADVVVVATGAWLPELAGALGVRVPVQAGRGYSFSVSTETPVEHPIYFPQPKVACTPMGGRLRIAGTMELCSPDTPLRPRRIEAIAQSVRPLLCGVDWDDMDEMWVGPRPMTPDGLPLIGPSAVPGVFVAAGHGMWGVTLGPVTGKLIAQQIVHSSPQALLRPFDPQRRP